MCDNVTGLTTAQTMQAASFPTFPIDTTGGQGLPWRQYNGQTTPLLEAFLFPITVQAGSLTTTYNASQQTTGFTTYGAQPALLFGSGQVTGTATNAGTYSSTYGGGLYSSQLGYDLIASPTAGTLLINPAPLTLTGSSDTRQYDATTSSSQTPTYTGLVGNDSITSLTQSFASPNVLGTNGSTLNVKAGYVVNDGKSGAN